MKGEEEKLLPARQRMVDTQLRARGICHAGVLEAFRLVPRELFLPAELKHEAYVDGAMPIGFGQTISQPYVVALMLQEMEPKTHHRVLDVGAGSGYQAALLARMVKHVYAIERLQALRERAEKVLADLHVTNVTFRTGDGSLGWPEEAPFDGIICGAGAPSVPDAWLSQLADGGRIVLPLGGREVQTIVVVEKTGGEVRRRELCDVRFVRLIGRDGWAD